MYRVSKENRKLNTNYYNESRNKKYDVLYDANVYDVRSDAVLPKIQDVN